MLINEAILVKAQHAASFPFNLKFKANLKGTQVQGPGLYTISFDKKPVYFGKFQPFQRNNIFNDRWLRHLETFTLRGTRVGFGNNSTLDKVASTVSHDVYKLLTDLSCTEKVKRFRDTGVVSSVARRSFASTHWNYFSQAKPDNILERFELRFFKLNGITCEQQAKSETSRIEEQMIRAFNFPLNSNWGEQQDFKIEDVERRLLSLTSNTSFNLRLCLLLRGDTHSNDKSLIDY